MSFAWSDREHVSHGITEMNCTYSDRTAKVFHDFQIYDRHEIRVWCVALNVDFKTPREEWNFENTYRPVVEAAL